MFQVEAKNVATRRIAHVTAGFGWMHASGVGVVGAVVGLGRLTGQKYAELLEGVLLASVQVLLFHEGE